MGKLTRDEPEDIEEDEEVASSGVKSQDKLRELFGGLSGKG